MTYQAAGQAALDEEPPTELELPEWESDTERAEIISELDRMIAPRYADVLISLPAAYEVFVDGARMGETPLEDSIPLSVGEHFVRVTREDYEDIEREILDAEMTVVRNEFERGENSNTAVLDERVFSTAYLWHNYGNSTIGARADLENVPIERLQAFYRKYYQPDNAMLVVAGSFELPKALAYVEKYFGAIPRPQRIVATRRSGSQQGVAQPSTAYRKLFTS